MFGPTVLFEDRHPYDRRPAGGADVCHKQTSDES
jgi:hypothetical protein